MCRLLLPRVRDWNAVAVLWSIAVCQATPLEETCAGLGVPPRESHRYGFYLGIALARAAELGRIPCLDALLSLTDPAVDADTVDHSGLTALAHAAKRGDIAPFESLVPRTSIGCEDWACRAPLALASKGGHAKFVGMLLDAKAGVDGVDPEGKTPLQLASAGGFLDTVELLLRERADVSRTAPEDRRTALHRAASHGHDVVVGKLVAAGADRSPLDAWQHTAQDLAAQQGHVVVVSTLNNDVRSGSSSRLRGSRSDERSQQDVQRYRVQDELRLERERLFAMEQRLEREQEV